MVCFLARLASTIDTGRAQVIHWSDLHTGDEMSGERKRMKGQLTFFAPSGFVPCSTPKRAESKVSVSGLMSACSGADILLSAASASVDDHRLSLFISSRLKHTEAKVKACGAQ